MYLQYVFKKHRVTIFCCETHSKDDASALAHALVGIGFVTIT